MSINRAKIDEKRVDVKKTTTIMRLLSYLREYKFRSIAVICMMAINSLIVVLLPVITEQTIDVYIRDRNIKMIYIMLALYLILIFTWWILYILRVRIMSKISNNIVLKIRSDCFTHLQKLSLFYFDSRPTGKILSRVIGDVTSLKNLLNQAITTLIPNLFFLLVVVLAMILINPILAIGALLSLPITALGAFYLIKKAYPHWYGFRQKQSNLSGFVHEIFSGIKIIQSFNADKESEDEFKYITNEVMSEFRSAVKFSDLLNIVIKISQGVGYFFLYLFAIYILKLDYTSVGELIAYASYITLFFQPISSLASMYNQLNNNISGAIRVFEILDEKPGFISDNEVNELSDVKGDVEFKNVTFAYPDDPSTLILDDVSFKIERGKKVALVGPTGAGKTTIVNMLCRFYDPIKGQVLIDNNDISRLDISSLRVNVGVMTQDSYLFSGTIKDNLRYGNSSISDDEMIKACKLINADSFISKLKDGYDTQLQDASLSMGQKQLIALTRVLLLNPKILILDEATSNIDTESEILVQRGIELLMRGRTCFVVAHRLSTIRNADIIYYVDKKGVLEAGSHEELLKRDGYYATLYKAQFSLT